MGTSVESAVESDRCGAGNADLAPRVRLLGPLAISRGGAVVALPGSRKMRALLAYLALAPHPVPRSQLCELLWDVPNDPRGELRWCLSKIRSVLDEPGRRRVRTAGDTVALDLSGCAVDAVEVTGAFQDVGTVGLERLRALAKLFAGDFLDGLEIDRSPAFDSWLAAQRRRFRGCHIALLERLAESAAGTEGCAYLEKWLELAPFDLRAHQRLLAGLASQGRIKEGEKHLATTTRLFHAEGLELGDIHDVWLAVRTREQGVLPARAMGPLRPPEAGAFPDGVTVAASRRASIAVMPFSDRSAETGLQGGIADALAHDVITRLAKLRSLFVIAQGTVFALQERGIGVEEAGRMLGVDYVVGGSVLREGRRLTVMVELVERRTARIVWAEAFDHGLDDAFLVLDEIGNRIVASIASEIETAERNLALLKPPNSLDAWEAHHRGLWHMYRFNRTDNERAQHFFRMALRLDPTFARPYAGLSFTHFQNAFQGWTQRQPEIDRAYEAAGQSLMIDERDPAAHLAMGRALWLYGRREHSVQELEKSIELSPNFASGHYSLAFVNCLSGDADAAIRSADHSRQLSPFDPLLFAMLGARSMALVRLHRFDEAAEWGIKAASRPNAHEHILAIAAYALALAGRIEEAKAYLATIRKTVPGYTVEDFLAAMQFARDGQMLFRESGKLLR